MLMDINEQIKDRMGNPESSINSVNSICYGVRMYWLGRTDKINDRDFNFYIDLTNEHSGFNKKLDQENINHKEQKFDPDKELINYTHAENNIKKHLESWVKENLDINGPKKKKRFGLF